MAAATRFPSEKERENNKNRERKRRAFQSRMLLCLRQDDELNLPKLCDNNEVLKAVCRRAGYIVEQDGTTFKPRQLDDEEISLNGSMKTAFNASSSGDMHANGSALQWLNPATALVSPASQPARRAGSFSAPVTPPLSSPRSCALARPHDCIPDHVLSNSSQSSPTSKGDFTKAEGRSADQMCEFLPSKGDTGPWRMLPNPPKAKHGPDMAANRLDLPAGDFMDFTSSSADFPADFAGFKDCNNFFASSSSTPTHAASRLLSGRSTPSCFYTSGTCTPVQSSLYSSGACTPTSYSNGARALPLHFAAAISNLALAQSQEDPQDEEKSALDVLQNKKLACLSTSPLPSQGRLGLESLPEGMPLLTSNVCVDVREPQLHHLSAERVSDARRLETDFLKRQNVVKPWEGETIHGEDDLELTLGSKSWRSKPG